MSIELFEHNAKAYHDARFLLDTVGKAAVIHPTGTGKSFIAFKLCEDEKDKTVCWLSPSEYIFKTQIENLKRSCGGYEPKNIKFYTYAKLMQMDTEEIALISPDYIILDEFHRCGAEMWGRGVDSLLVRFPTVPVLGLSATAIRYLDNQRNMADELFDGNIASEMTLGEAIVRGILKPPKYVQAVFSYQNELGIYEKKIKYLKSKATRDVAERYLEALRRALEKADGLDVVFEKHITDRSGKYIVFCSNSEHMREMIEKTDEWFSFLDKEPHVYSVYSDDPETSREFAEFKCDCSDRMKLLFCIDMLNEGIHVDDVAGVILFRPTVSPTVYKQQIGRALAAGNNRIPLIFDIVNNIENLYSIGAIEKEMHDAVIRYRMSDGEGDVVNETFTVIDEVKNCRELFERLNETLSASWDVMYSHAKAFFEEHGHLDVPKKYKTEEGYSLGTWLLTQRRVKNGKAGGILSPDRIAKLEAIGIRWDSHSEHIWDRFIDACALYKETYGNLVVPVSYVTEDGLKLGRWIANQRAKQKSSGENGTRLSEEKTLQLDELGMIWNYTEYVWKLNYSAAQRYFNEFGNIDVPLSYVTSDGIKLGKWIYDVRASVVGANKVFAVTECQIQMLTSLGMKWNSRKETNWNTGFEEAKEYYRNNGDLDVAYTYVTEEGFKLGDWICNQREAYRYGRLKSDRKEKLDSIGMIWIKPDSWKLRFALAKSFYDEYGHLQIPANYKVGKINLWKWVNEQKQVYKGKRHGKRLSREQVENLESIGISW